MNAFTVLPALAVLPGIAHLAAALVFILAYRFARCPVCRRQETTGKP